MSNLKRKRTSFRFQKLRPPVFQPCVLDGFERKPHENPSIGLILCKDMNKSFVDYVIQDYARPMGVATYKTSKDMSDELKKALPDVEALREPLDNQEE